MPDDRVSIFESTDSVMLKSVGKALDDAGIAHEVRFDRPTLMQYGPKKPPRRIVVAADVEGLARVVADAAAAHRQRVVDTETESQRYRRYAAPNRDAGGGDGGIYLAGDGGSSCSGGGGCGGD